MGNAAVVKELLEASADVDAAREVCNFCINVSVSESEMIQFQLHSSGSNRTISLYVS